MNNPILPLTALFCIFTQSVSGEPLGTSQADLPNCVQIVGGEARDVEAATLGKLMNPVGGYTRAWFYGMSAEEQRVPATVHVRLAFKEAEEIGSLAAVINAQNQVRIRALRLDAPYPGDPDVEGQWTELPFHRSGYQFDAVFEAGFRTRAILVSDNRRGGQTHVSQFVVRRERLFNRTPYAIAQGEESPYGYPPSNLVAGKPWRNTDKEPQGERILREPISGLKPAWANLVWPEGQELSLVRIRGNAEELELREFIGDAGTNPALAPETAWRAVAEKPQVVSYGRDSWDYIYSFAKPKVATALQIRSTKVASYRGMMKSIFILDHVAAYQDLGNTPIPAPPKRGDVLSPVRFAYETDVDSEPAVVINSADGQRVRNLSAQAFREAGEQMSAWDLRDDHGLPVQPGTYHWEVLYGPKPRLVHQFTPYPDIYKHSPESSPWGRAPHDGWLTNHANQNSVCRLGDSMFLGAGYTEGGHGLIEVANSGKKLWGTHETAEDLFSDGQTVFIHQKDEIRRLDREKGKEVVLFKTGQDPARRGKLVGMAAKDGRVYLAFHAPVPYLENATQKSNLDLGHSLPKLRKEVPGRANYGIPGTPQEDFVSLFRMGEFVNGSDHNGGLIKIPSTEGAGKRQHILLAFEEPTPLGSLVFPPYEAPEGVTMTAAVLKAGAKFPPDLSAEKDWVPVKLGKLGAWNCIPVPEGTMTRAILLTFSQPGNALDDLIDAEGAGGLSLDVDLGLSGKKKQTGLLAVQSKGNDWKGTLEGMRILRRRFANLMESAKVRTSSGKYDAETGFWDAKREGILSESDPGIFMLEWDKPQKLRGISIKEIDAERTLVDVYTGSAGSKINMAGEENWTQVAEYKQGRRYLYQPSEQNNAEALYIDGVVDFGKEYETRAVRLRMVSQWKEQTGRAWGIRADRGGRTVDLKRCRLYGIAALQYIGGEPKTAAISVQRMEVWDAATGKILEEKPSGISGEIAFGPDGKLYGLTENSVVCFDDGKEVVTGLENPKRLAISPDGEFYVFDLTGDSRQVKAFGKDGKFLRKIGKPGFRQAGHYDPEYIEAVNEMDFDSDGNLWIVYSHRNPRRVMKFSPDGKFLTEFLGNTNYGGGGQIDPWDPTRLYFRDMVFGLDWETGKSKVAAIMMEMGEPTQGLLELTEPLVVNGQRYIVTSPLGVRPDQNVGAVFLVDEGTLAVRPAGAVGLASSFPPIQKPEFIAKVGGEALGGYRFIWNDLDMDGKPEPSEVDFTAHGETRFNVGRFDHELGVQSGKLRYEVSRFLNDGTPVFTERELPFPADFLLPTGNYFRYGKEANEVLTPEGKIAWSYPASQGMQGLFVPPFQPGVVNLQYGIKGGGKTDPSGLGDFFVMFNNHGQAEVWTADGFLAARLTSHVRDPEHKTLAGMEHHRGADVTGTTLGQEHFFNYFSQVRKDGRCFLNGGHLTVSLFEVLGLHDYKRIRGTVEVTPENIAETRQWEAGKAGQQQFASPKMAKSLPGKAVLDGVVDANEYKSKVLEIEGLAELSVQHDSDALYLAWEVRREAGPWANHGTEFQRIFKTGGAVDIRIGTNPSAHPDRTKPVLGDLRIVLTNFNDKPVAVVYKPVSQSKGNPWETFTEAGGTTTFDDVSIQGKIQMKHFTGDRGYTLEAAIPWEVLGLKKPPANRIKFDWGVLSTDTGQETTARQAWANPMFVGTTDEPTEARLNPSLWGWLEFESKDKSAPDLDQAFKKKKGKDLDSLLDLEL